MKAAICDDSYVFIHQLSSLYISYCESHGINGTFNAFVNGRELLEGFDEDFDIVFLDIRMPGLNGIDTARRLRNINPDVFIVFVTSFIEFAPAGYEVEAFRYLLKDKIDLTFESCMESIEKQLSSKNKRVFFKFIEGDIKLTLESLIYVESVKHKLFFYIANRVEPYTLYRKLDEIEKLINSPSFLRVHKSYLVNMAYIDIVHRYQAILSKGIEIPIPKNKYSEVLQKYILFRG